MVKPQICIGMWGLERSTLHILHDNPRDKYNPCPSYLKLVHRFLSRLNQPWLVWLMSVRQYGIKMMFICSLSYGEPVTFVI